MARGDVLHDGEAQARPPRLAAVRGVDAVEALGQARQVERRDAAAEIVDAEARAPVLAGDENLNAPPSFPYFTAFWTRFSPSRIRSSRSP